MQHAALLSAFVPASSAENGWGGEGDGGTVGGVGAPSGCGGAAAAAGVVARGKKKHATSGGASSCGRGATGAASVTPCPHP